MDSGKRFTFVELALAALILLATGLIVLVSCMPKRARGDAVSAVPSRASALAAETAEELLTAPTDDRALTAGAHADPANPRDGVYDVRWVVEDGQPLPHLKRVTVSVASRGREPAAEAQIVLATPGSGG